MKYTAKSVTTIPISRALAQPPLSAASSRVESPPYVLYLSNTTFEPSYVSPNSKDLLGIAAEQLIGNRSIWNRLIPDCDQENVFERFKALDRSAEVSCVHRILNGGGVPTWVSHRVTAVVNDGVRTLCGFIMPIAGNDLLRLVEPSTISSFIHKLGNHFQLLNLAVDSLRKAGADPSDVNVVRETLDKAVVMTRAFSEYTQVPVRVPAFDFSEVIEAAMTMSSAGSDSKIEIHHECDPSVSGSTMAGDPYLLELAVGAILQNAIEAMNKGGKIDIRTSVDSLGYAPAGLKLVVSDNGAGISAGNLPKVMLPFFSTKPNHIGLGLSMACRFVEMHRGIVRLESTIAKGTEVLILLPLNRDVQDACR